MERPTKRIKISNPQIKNPRDTGSRMTEGLFTSETGIRGGESDRDHHRPTRTINLSDFQRRNIYGEYQRIPRPVLPRRNAGIYLLPRAPDATVTAAVVQINVNDGTSISKMTEVPAATTGTVVSLPDIGSLTVPGVSDVTSLVVTTISDSSQETITTPPPTSSTSIVITTPSSELSSTISVYSNGYNSTTALLGHSSTSQHTVTVTATRTFEFSFINGTIIATDTITGQSNFQATVIPVITSSSSDSFTYTFGQLDPTSTTSSDRSSAYDATPTDYFSNPTASGTGANAGTGAAAGAGGSTTASSPSSATSDAGSGSRDSGPGLTPHQQTLVGGVVGGVAGVAVMLLIVLMILRYYRRRLKARGELPEQMAAREISGGAGATYPMSQRSSNTPIVAALTHSLNRLRPHSGQTFATTATGVTESSVRDSERGFQRIAGRKIPPVLSSGGDPYGGNYGAFEKDTSAGPSDPLNKENGLAGASFYRDEGGFYGGKGTNSPTFPPSPTTATSAARTGEAATTSGTTSSARDFAQPYLPIAHNNSQLSLNSPSKPEGFAIMRPSPARTPVTLSPAASSIRLPIQQVPAMDENVPPMPANVPFLLQRDGVGRSLASLDGSRVSRSSARSGGRFMENM